MPVEPIPTPSAPPVAGPYSPAVRAGDWLVLAGQVGLDPKSGQMVEGGVEAQARQVLANVQAVLADCGASITQVAKTTVFGAGWLVAQDPSAGAGNPEFGKVVRSGASCGSDVPTRSCPLAGSCGRSRNFALLSSACNRVAPRLEKTKRASGVTSSTFCSGRLVMAAPAGAPEAAEGPPVTVGLLPSGVAAGAVCAIGAGEGGRTGKNFVQAIMTATQRPIARMIRFSMFFLLRVPR